MSAFHRQFSPNQRGRDFVVGDLHGCRDALDRALAAHAFNPSDDRLFSVGDLIDRGPDSLGCLALLDEPWFYATLGNHEMLMIDAVREDDHTLWYLNGGGWSRGIEPDRLSEIVERLSDLPHAITVALGDGRRVGLTHAECPVDDWRQVEALADDTQARQRMVWGRNIIGGRIERTVDHVDLTVHGHTPTDAPVRLGNALFIDTGCVYGGPLTVLTMEAALAEGL